MSTTSNLPLSTAHLQRKAWQAWLRLKQARADCDISGMTRAEREMNVLLDQLSSRNLAAAS